MKTNNEPVPLKKGENPPRLIPPPPAGRGEG